MPCIVATASPFRGEWEAAARQQRENDIVQVRGSLPVPAQRRDVRGLLRLSPKLRMYGGEPAMSPYGVFTDGLEYGGNKSIVMYELLLLLFLPARGHRPHHSHFGWLHLPRIHR